jgi:hypothetical protein
MFASDSSTGMRGGRGTAIAAAALIAALALLFSLLSHSNEASAHSTHYGVVSSGGCNVNPKKPITQYWGNGDHVQWAKAYIGQGCSGHHTAVWVALVYQVDNQPWIRTSGNNYVGATPQYAYGPGVDYNCAWGNHIDNRSAVGISFNDQAPSSWHRDADEHLYIAC